VEIRAGQREPVAVALGTGEIVARHTRRFARHLTIACPGHERALRELRTGDGEVEVEVRPLERYDRLIPA
jgi:hypothetical protein